MKQSKAKHPAKSSAPRPSTADYLRMVHRILQAAWIPALPAEKGGTVISAITEAGDPCAPESQHARRWTIVGAFLLVQHGCEDHELDSALALICEQTNNAQTRSKPYVPRTWEQDMNVLEHAIVAANERFAPEVQH